MNLSPPIKMSVVASSSCHNCGWVNIKCCTNCASNYIKMNKQVANTAVDVAANADVKDAAANVKDADAKDASDVDVKDASDVDVKDAADAKDTAVDASDADVDIATDLNILTYHKSAFIEMIKMFRPDVSMSAINNEISIYKNELNMDIYTPSFTNRYLLKDFKNEIYVTLLPILQIIFINNDIKKSLSEIIIQEIQNIIDNNEQLILLLIEFSIFLKILQPCIYGQFKKINKCINKFLNVRIQSNNTEKELFIIYNNQNMVLYNIFFLFSKKIVKHSNLILTTEFLELAINKKIKNIMQISRDNKYKRTNLHLFQCTHCGDIFDNQLLIHCACGQTFCSKDCQFEAWGSWHKEICPNRQFSTTQQCLGCMKYFEKQDIFKCTQCMSAKYCGRVCQKRDWKYHRQYCNK